ncbi:helix-turn-helix transcriptional regulator [Ferrovibrio sp. MS7]|uniref:ArsR/SmtB family transcription factor n=1 Tax=Ferrovibrio plantarum TaxID=3119164 RepID=UPI00313671DF
MTADHQSGPSLAEIAALIGDPARANMLAALMAGQALTASELALIAGIAPSTASSHLGKLQAGGLLAQEAQGRHRYFRLNGPLVAQALEAIMAVAGAAPKPKRLPGPRDADMRRARTCYDHIAGELGVKLTDALIARGCIERSGQDFILTQQGRAFFDQLGIDLAGLKVARRGLARVCLDWSERRPHLAGALGAALARHCLKAGWVAQAKGARTLSVTRTGKAAFEKYFAVAA